ncbi:MAG: hypothetical protein JEZ06_18615 [Anaerolineaceae bacterium]|nr:hypothetical protein [Anaerolineaceae bacterium]
MTHDQQHLVHMIATPVMIVLYTIRLIILMRLRLAKDKAPARGLIFKGVVDAFLTLAMPWKMESTRKNMMYYVEFMAFHLGLFANIGLAYLYTYAHKWTTQPLVSTIFIVFIALGLVAGIIRFRRRFTQPDLKIISSFDDYFSLFLVLLFKITGILLLLGYPWASWAYFLIVGFFLVYAPFSKIHHYLYYPFARFFYGSGLARKGIE